MAPVDLNRNKEAILKLHKEVSDPNSATNWALFGYEGHTDVLKVIGKGDGGITEFVDELNSGRIMYGYLKIIDPNTNLPKFVFVNWQGEGCPELRKGACANHIRDVTNLLRGAHVTINARNENDVEEDDIVNKVSKASGANYSFHKEEKRPDPGSGPVGSVYQKVKPQIEIKPNVREKFWEDTAKEEKNRVIADQQRRQTEKTKLDKEIKDRELEDAKKREEREGERVKRAREIKQAEQRANATDTKQDQAKWQEVQRQALLDDDERHGRSERLGRERAADREQENSRRDEEERGKRSDQMRKDRAAEAQSLISGRTHAAKNIFEDKPTSQFDNPRQPPPARKIKTSFGNTSETSAQQERKQPIQLPKAATPPPEDIYDEAQTTANAPDDVYDDTTVVEKSTPSPSLPPARNLLSQGLPKRQASDDEQEDNWEEEPESTENYEEVGGYSDHGGQAAPEETYEDTAAFTHHKEPDHEEPGTELYEDTAQFGGGGTHHPEDESSAGTGITARALYDYQAAEENEITFDPDEIISNIEMIDDGWWIGDTKDGKRGMFPANYVELING